MRSVRIHRLAAGAGLALALLAFSFGASAEPKAWDQKAVTTVATKLAAAVKDLNLTVRKDPDAVAGSATRRAQYNARESLKMLVTVSQRLASQLKSGEDKDATMPTYKRLQSVRRDAAEDGKKANIPGPTLEKVESARALLLELEPYFEDPPEAAAPAPTQ